MKKTTGIIIAVAFVAGTLIAMPQASAAPAAPNPNSSSAHTLSTRVQAEAVSHWTPARMAAARTVDAKPVPLAGKTTTQPTSDVSPVTLTQIPGALGTPKLPTAVGPLRDPVTRPYTNRPDRLNGKVFFTAADGFDYQCSGTLVNSSNKDMVDTAGHCVADGAGYWHSNWVFIPGYSSRGTGWGDAPFGIWPARTQTTKTDWLINGNLKEDYGYGVLGTQGGWHAVNKFGGQGVYFNAAHVQTMQEFGYPAAPPYNSYDQRYTVSKSGGADDPMGPSYFGPPTIMIKSWQTGGTSGGGWIVGVNPSTGLGHLNSHSSYRYIGGPKANPSHLYGPYFGNDALSLYNFTRAY